MATYTARRQSGRDYGTLLLAVSMDPREVGRHIAAARNRRGWTQLAFALEANVSPGTVQRWEAGKLPPVRELMRIAEVLGVEPSDLVELEPTGEDQLAALRREVAELRELAEEILRRSA